MSSFTSHYITLQKSVAAESMTNWDFFVILGTFPWLKALLKNHRFSRWSENPESSLYYIIFSLWCRKYQNHSSEKEPEKKLCLLLEKVLMNHIVRRAWRGGAGRESRHLLDGPKPSGLRLPELMGDYQIHTWWHALLFFRFWIHRRIISSKTDLD